MVVNSNTFNFDTFGVPCLTDSSSVSKTPQSDLNQRTASVLQWLSRIRTRLQELWSGTGKDDSVPTIHVYLTVSKEKHLLQANHLTCDGPEIAENHRLTLTARLNQVLRELKNDKILDEQPNLVGFWVELKS
jgi:hypothetical protein